mgnify:CR=1 FL=1
MNAVLDNKIHKCLGVWNKVPTSASFADVELGVWNWENGFDDWVEVESPEAVFEIGDDCLRYDKTYKTWKIHKVHESYFNYDFQNGREIIMTGRKRKARLIL